mgnify:CR=1 FL=1
MKYDVEYQNKVYRYNADDAMDAFELFAGRKVFGRDFAEKTHLIAVDKKTRGYRWALYAVEHRRSGTQRVKVKLAVD